MYKLFKKKRLWSFLVLRNQKTWTKKGIKYLKKLLDKMRKFNNRQQLSKTLKKERRVKLTLGKICNFLKLKTMPLYAL